MKKLSYLSCIAGLLSLFSCGGQSDSNQYLDSVYTDESKDSIYSLNSYYDVQDDVVVRGTKYRYSYSFYPDTSLAIVTNSFGFKYYDNVLDLKIFKGGEEFYSHRFTKKSFASHIKSNLMDNYALLGFNFNYMNRDDHSKFHFIATVGDPDESGETPHTFAVDISTDGNISLTELAGVEEGPEEEGV